MERSNDIRHFSWEDIENDIRKLADMIKSDFVPDYILVLAEGGWIPGRLLKNFIKTKYYSVGCKHYDEDDNMLDKITLYQNISADKIVGKNVLILDEVCDSGETLQKITGLIKKMQPKVLKTAVLHRKESAVFTPDFIARNLDDSWIKYPWTLK